MGNGISKLSLGGRPDAQVQDTSTCFALLVVVAYTGNATQRGPYQCIACTLPSSQGYRLSYVLFQASSFSVTGHQVVKVARLTKLVHSYLTR